MLHCKVCGNLETHEEIMPEGFMHYSKIICAEPECGKFITWGRKPENEKKRHDKNDTWKKMHREATGEYVCVWCGANEKIFSDANSKGWRFQLDHINMLAEDGQDVFENTQILCHVCHEEKHGRRKLIKEVLKRIEEKGGEEECQNLNSNLNDTITPPWEDTIRQHR